MPVPLPSWPENPPTHGGVRLRPFSDRDVPMVMALATDPYVPLIGSLPADADAEAAREWIERQHGRLGEGTGLSFAIAETGSDEAVGAIGLWLQELSAGRATAGYAVSPSYRGRGAGRDALRALTAFAWTIAGLHRIELYIEPENAGSIGVAEAAGFVREGLLRSHQQIGDRRRDMLLFAITRP